MLTPHALRLGSPILALLAFGAGCSKHERPRQYPFRGDVVRLDPNTNLASIHNEKVEGWMSEMTMDYPIENRSEYLSLRKGEKITATVNVTSEGYWLTNVKKMKEK
jgi:Cu/Ag efflux protein CusF